MRLNAFLLLLCVPLIGMSQETINLGAPGSPDGITVYSSSAYAPDFWDTEASGEKTIHGIGLEGKIVEASRLIGQCTFGADLDYIKEVADLGAENWLDQQFELPMSSLLEELREVFSEVVDWYIMNGGDSSDINFDHLYWNNFNYAWWNLNMTNDDKLRQRAAYALSQIMVISIESDLASHGYGISSYYDILARHAFGNYRDLLLDVTLHPCMGFYLSHLNNPKAIPEDNIHPDENYAREVQQLFSIGLYELNLDGSRKTDVNGKWIPTYGQLEIKEFAKIFTGLGVSDVIPNMYTDEAYFGEGIYLGDLTQPMKMYEEWHQQGTKFLLNGHVVPSGQPGMQDIEDAIDNLFNHPNVGPFIGRRLIQHLVTSNPSPGYIARVATVFNDNGEGERGDMKAVIKAILVDPEARTCDALEQAHHGKLREPFVRYAHFASSMDIEQYYGRYWNAGYNFWESTGQSPLAAPSVFNFFLPDYQPIGPVADADMVAPEFQVHNSRTGVGFINKVNDWAVWNYVMDSWEEGDPWVTVNFDQLRDLAFDPEALLNRLDLIFTHGQLSDRTRDIVKSAIEPLITGDFRQSRVELATYLIMISPDYAILK